AYTRNHQLVAGSGKASSEYVAGNDVKARCSQCRITDETPS
ncbi:MAG: hypothetical protein JWQ78_1324, partial [Sediminibacterium sp.]|nr:hypothetical protein [Sediminibacterium sp.]